MMVEQGRVWRSALLAAGVVWAACGLSPSVHAQGTARPKPSEQVWVAAAPPPGGVSWAVLETTREIQRQKDGVTLSRPAFSPKVKALAAKRIKVSGYVMPLQNSARQTHFVLLAYPPDCPYHLNPAPMQFIEVRTVAPVAVKSGAQSFEGQLVLGGQDESGIFYRLTASREL
ncbi:DUF3299 domain-containing protein [Novosphingobium sp.]|uniref:DUF3299 domain-containing protein n=1 Tax=Novosphingobium sp. TaxID=1874826 RepID=UPI0026117355|nr:DUF3299 domain-containing protein [Novosphingobium sp.]